MSTALAEAFRRQSDACAALGSPFMARLMALAAARLAPGGAVADRLLSWEGDVGPSGASLPLRFAGALHALVLDGSDPGLARAYPPHEAGDAALWAEVARALEVHADRLLAWLDSPPQTNEVRRSAGLIAALHWLAGRHGFARVRLSELGASAGLNLALDAFRLKACGIAFGPADAPVRLAPDWTGPVPPPRAVAVTSRAGVDLNPLDPARAADRLRLLAYLWPDQPQRLALTRAAIGLAGTRPDRGDAAPWLARRLDDAPRDEAHVVFNTVAWQYFPEATQAACRAAMEAAGARATPAAPLVHLSMEADGQQPGALLSADIWDGSGPHRSEPLARIDFHGRWVHWCAD